VKIVYVKDPGVLAIERRRYFDNSVLVVWFLDGIQTIDVVEVGEYIEVTNKFFKGDMDD
jgi:hypothetical protein